MRFTKLIINLTVIIILTAFIFTFKLLIIRNKLFVVTIRNL